MFKREELENTFEGILQYSRNIEGISFVVNLEMLNIHNDRYLKHSTFELGNNGLLELILLSDGGILEYDRKIKNLNDLKYAITHLDEWVDDWNQEVE